LSSAPRSPPSAPANKLRRTAREIAQRYDDALAHSGVAVTQLPILLALGSNGDLPMTILAEKLSLDRTTLTQISGSSRYAGSCRSSRTRKMPACTSLR
jgi:DNA-binding MarR family transcriptional regulator